MSAVQYRPWMRLAAVIAFGMGALLTLVQLIYLASSLATTLHFFSVLSAIDPVVGAMAASTFATSISVLACAFVAWRFLRARKYAWMTGALALSGGVLPWLNWQMIGVIARVFGPA